MKKQHLLFATFILAGSLTVSGQTPDTADSLSAQRTLTIDEVVVTGTRHQTDIRHLSQTVSVVNRKRIEQSMQPSLLPVLTEQVPGLFTTSRGVMGYGVSNGAAGGISLRGLSGGNARLMVLIDGHPQYAGIFGHPIADAYQTLLADRVEVLRGPASVLYGSNAMGGVVNIVTRKMHEDGIRTHLHTGVTRNFAASLFRNIKYFTLRKLYLCRKWMQKRLQKTIKTGITLPNFDFLA